MQKLQPGDYYMEDGLMVFTRQFHLRRGRCCGCDCRHCPWRDGVPPELEAPKQPAAPIPGQPSLPKTGA